LAPGANIIGPASTSHKNSPDLVSNNGNSYVLLSGTSQAAAVVSGCAAIVRQYYIEERGHSPSAALLKSTIINSTDVLIPNLGNAAKEDDPSLVLSDVYKDPPNYYQGFGNVCLKFAIPNKLEPEMDLEFIDSVGEHSLRLIQQQGDGTESRTFTIKIKKHWFRVCLVWSDPGYGPIHNQLVLFVTDKNRTRTWPVGNHGTIEGVNNVQIIRIQDPEPGIYYIKIFAAQVSEPPQDFALVATL
jgi:serine protease AprX